MSKYWKMLLATLFFVPPASIYISTLKWINNLETTDCKCSEDHRRNYIKYWLGLFLMITSILYIYNIYHLYNDNTKHIINIIYCEIIIFVLSLINIYYSLTYIEKLKKEDCKCSEDITRDVYYTHIWILASIIILISILLLIGFIIYGKSMFAILHKMF